MKKLKLRGLAFGGSEVLTRSQLKNVMGGVVPFTDGCSTKKCFVDADCKGACLTCVPNPSGGSSVCSEHF